MDSVEGQRKDGAFHLIKKQINQVRLAPNPAVVVDG